jgi:putative acetyltransferase
MMMQYQNFLIRSWQPADREAAAQVIATALAEYGLGWEPEGADRDVLQVEECYFQTGGDFWVVEQQQPMQQPTIVATSAYRPYNRGANAVEIRKMYLNANVRGQGLGRFLLMQLEQAIQARGYDEIWLETASVLKTAVILYEKSGYEPATGVETSRCDRIYCKVL